MPGRRSLEEQQYYAHPRNAFWPILGECFSIDTSGTYEERVQLARRLPLVIWDVLQACERPGSLDGSIKRESEVPNPIHTLLEETHSLRVVLCNGQKAYELFRRHILPRLSEERRDTLGVHVLPSTSPANAGMSAAEKLARWRAAFNDDASRPT